MTDIERQLRAVTLTAPTPDPAWLGALEATVRGLPALPPTRRRRRWLLLPAAAIVTALAGAVLAVALRRPEPPPPPAPAATTAPPATTAAVLPVASPIAAALATMGQPSDPPRFTQVNRALFAPGTVRRLDVEAGHPPVYAYQLRNGAACLDVANAVDCALPEDDRLILEGQYDPLGDATTTSKVIVVVAPAVTGVTMRTRGRRTAVPLTGRVGIAEAPQAHHDFLLTLADGSTVRVGAPFPTAAKRPRAPAPSGAGRVSAIDVLPATGTPVALPDLIVPNLSGAAARDVPDAGSGRLLATGIGPERAAAYAWTIDGRRQLCIGEIRPPGSSSACGVPVPAHVLWLPSGQPFPDHVYGIAAPSVRRAWVELPDGTRVDATIDRHVVTALIPLDRTRADIHLLAELDDGTVIDERPELLR